MLTIEGLRAGYDRLEVLHGLGFSVETGDATVVMGANAAGKTTLCRVITGLIPACGGAIRLDGEDITRLSSVERVKRGIALAPEGRQVFGEMTVRENLRLGPMSTANRARAITKQSLGCFRSCSNARTSVPVCCRVANSRC